jgi:uncharacterized protein (TIGR03067 family)
MIQQSWIVRVGLLCGALAFIGGLTQLSGFAVSNQATTELEGTWDGDMSFGKGGSTRTFKPGEMWMTFKGNKAVAKGFLGPEDVEHVVELNPKVTPKHFDYHQDEKQVVPGIYELQGDTLTIAIPLGSVRPKGFKEADQEFRISTLRLKRRR